MHRTASVFSDKLNDNPGDRSIVQKTIQETLDRASSHIKEMDYGWARDELEEAKKMLVSKEADNLPLLSKCASLCVQAKDWSGAESFYSRILKLSPTDAESGLRGSSFHSQCALLNVYQMLGEYMSGLVKIDENQLHSKLWATYRRCIYNSLAIEGSTLTPGETLVLLERSTGRTPPPNLRINQDQSAKRVSELKELYRMELAMKFLSTRPFELGLLTVEAKILLLEASMVLTLLAILGYMCSA